MRHASHPERGRYRAPAPAALLLALCLLAGGAQAVPEPMDMASLVTGEVDRGASADTVVTQSPIATSNAADGEPFPGPAHAWAAGDVLSLHGVDRYRYIVVYTRETADGLVHGCYEVSQQASGRYEVSQYVHGQEVFGDAFLAEQGAKFIMNVPLDQVVITDDTPTDGGRTYVGMTLGSLFGAADDPVPTETPGPVPTAPLRPGLAPTAAPTGAVSVTRTPCTEATMATPTEAPFLAPMLETGEAIRAATVTPVVTAAPATPGFAHAKRYAVGNPGSFLGTASGSDGTSMVTRSPGAAITTTGTDTPGNRTDGTTPPTERFVRWYPAARWAAGID